MLRDLNAIFCEVYGFRLNCPLIVTLSGFSYKTRRYL